MLKRLHHLAQALTCFTWCGNCSHKVPGLWNGVHCFNGDCLCPWPHIGDGINNDVRLLTLENWRKIQPVLNRNLTFSLLTHDGLREQ
jgi:hypothetical protein